MAALLALALLATSGASPASPPHVTGVIAAPAVDLAFETYGRTGNGALPIIAVNGGPGLSHAYMMVNDLWKDVAIKRLVVLYDQRGTGGSRRVAKDASFSMDAQVADLEAVRAKLGLEKAAFLGDSYGGMLVMAYAAAHPEHVAKLILSDSPPPSWKGMVHLLPQTFPDVEEQQAAEAKKLGGDADAVARAGLVSHFRMIFVSPAKRDAYMAKMGDLGYEPAVARAVQRQSADLDLSDKLKGFTTFPTLVLTGRYDMNVAPLTAWRLYKAIPGAKFTAFEMSSHLPAYEEPERYKAVLEAFLDGK